MPYIEATGAKLFFEESGYGHPIIFIHEFASDLRGWEVQFQHFSRGYRCIAYNARGYPPSDVPEDAACYGWKLAVDDIAAVMHGLSIERAHLIGLSMGGYAALQFGLRYPEKVSAIVAASVGYGSDPTQRDAWLRETSVLARIFRDHGMEAMAERVARGPARIQLKNKDPISWQEFVARLRQHSPLGMSHTMARCQALRPPLHDLRDQFSDMAIPVLLAVGDEDAACLETNVMLKSALPNAGLWICQNTGHGIHLEEPAAFNAQVECFLSAVECGNWRHGHPGTETQAVLQWRRRASNAGLYLPDNHERADAELIHLDRKRSRSSVLKRNVPVKPRIGVYLSEGAAARLTEAARRPGATKSALVETALDRLLGSEDDCSETATLGRQFAAMSGQLQQLDRSLRIVNETVALHARFHLAVTPLMPAVAQEAACRLGAERFEEFAAQVGRRVDRGVPLLQETIDRISAARAPTPQDGLVEAPFTESPTRGSSNEGNNEGGAAVVPEQSAQAARATARQVLASLAANGSLIARVFLPFVAGYYLAYLFRTINAVMASPLANELGLSAGDLGLLTSVYFLTFAAAQIPIGMLLDRYGPRRVQSTLMVVAALGSALFAASENFSMLLLGRALIGLGVASALTAGMQALVLWFPRERVPLLNGWMVMLGALGAVTATWPAELLLTSIGWRELFGLLAALTAVCAIMVHFVVPEAAPASKAVSVGLKKVYTDPRFWRLAPLSASCIGTAWALQGLWAAQWLADVDGLDRAGVVQHLFIMAVALCVGAIGLGIAADRLRRRGTGPEVLLVSIATVFVATQLALILRLPLPTSVLWSGVAATGAATVLSYAILAEYFPKELTGRANGALNLFHIGTAFAVQYAIGVIVQQWVPDAGHYPERAYQTAFALNVVFQIAAWIWFMMPRVSLRSPSAWQPSPSET